MGCATSQSENAVQFIRALANPCLAAPATGDESLSKAFGGFFRFVEMFRQLLVKFLRNTETFLGVNFVDFVIHFPITWCA